MPAGGLGGRRVGSSKGPEGGGQGKQAALMRSFFAPRATPAAEGPAGGSAGEAGGARAEGGGFAPEEVAVSARAKKRPLPSPRAGEDTAEELQAKEGTESDTGIMVGASEEVTRATREEETREDGGEGEELLARAAESPGTPAGAAVPAGAPPPPDWRERLFGRGQATPYGASPGGASDAGSVQTPSPDWDVKLTYKDSPQVAYIQQLAIRRYAAATATPMASLEGIEVHSGETAGEASASTALAAVAQGVPEDLADEPLYLDREAADRDLTDIMGAVDGIMHSQQLGQHRVKCDGAEPQSRGNSARAASLSDPPSCPPPGSRSHPGSAPGHSHGLGLSLGLPPRDAAPDRPRTPIASMPLSQLHDLQELERKVSQVLDDELHRGKLGSSRRGGGVNRGRGAVGVGEGATAARKGKANGRGKDVRGVKGAAGGGARGGTRGADGLSTAETARGIDGGRAFVIRPARSSPKRFVGGPTGSAEQSPSGRLSPDGLRFFVPPTEGERAVLKLRWVIAGPPVRTGPREVVLCLKRPGSRAGDAAGTDVDGVKAECVLRDAWAGLEVEEGDVVNIIAGDLGGGVRPALTDRDLKGDAGEPPRTVVDRSSGWFIVHPDVLISGTRVGDAHQCLRKAALQERGGCGGESSAVALLGTMLHEIFQVCVAGGRRGDDDLRKSVIDVCRDHAAQLCEVGMSDTEAYERLCEGLPSVRAWADTFMPTKGPGGRGAGRMGGPVQFGGDRGQPPLLHVERVVDIEEAVWSPSWGLKGLVDASVEVSSSADQYARKVHMPLEVKTGKDSMGNLSHRAQVMLYCLLLGEARGADVSEGMLYYTRGEGRVDGVRASRADLMHLLIMRNELARYVRKAQLGAAQGAASLPPVARDEGKCSRCFQLDVCALHHRAIEGGTDASFTGDNPGDAEDGGGAPGAPLGEGQVTPPGLLSRRVGHLSATHLEYFKKWDALVTVEHARSSRLESELWKMGGAEREARGKGAALGGLRLALTPDMLDKISTAMSSGSGSDECVDMARVVGDMSLDLEAVARARGRAVLSGTGDAQTAYRHPHAFTRWLDEGGALSKDRGPAGGASSLAASGLSTGDFVMVSFEEGGGRPERLAVARGVVGEVRPGAVEVLLNRRLELKPDPEVSRLQEGMRLDGYDARAVWRVDRLEASASTLNASREALLGLMQHPEGAPANQWLADQRRDGRGTSTQDHYKDRATIAQNLRRLVIDLEPPSVGADSAGATARARARADAYLARPEAAGLNPDQQGAIGLVLSEPDYALISGTPGSGKSATVAHAVAALSRSRGPGESRARVLLCAYTHNAVDNVLLALKKIGFHDFVRLGRGHSGDDSDKTDTERALAPHGVAQRARDLSAMMTDGEDERPTAETLAAVVRGASVVAVTCLGAANNPVLAAALKKSGVFDVCVLDEAGQLTQPVALSPLLQARRFVLVGDVRQLPPLVQSREAAERGMAVSLLERLQASPGAVPVTRQLTHQYRMNEAVMSVANSLVYAGALCAASAAVGNATLPVNPEAWAALRDGALASPGRAWLRAVADPERSVVFLDTDGAGPAFREARTGGSTASKVGGGQRSETGSLYNPGEARVTAAAVDALCRAGVSAGDIGVIAPYRAQVAELRRALDRSGYANVEAHTVDRYQGRDKLAIILSLVHTTEAGGEEAGGGQDRSGGGASFSAGGGLLADWRRVNVALTRAKTKLIIVGSTRGVAGRSNVFRRFFELCDDPSRAHWRMPIPAGLSA